MTLPIVTRYVKIEAETSAGDEAMEAPEWTVLHAAVPAHIGSPSGSSAGDTFAAVDQTLYVESTVTLPIRARVTDLATGDVYSVQWTQVAIGLGLDHRKAGVNRVNGVR